MTLRNSAGYIHVLLIALSGLAMQGLAGAKDKGRKPEKLDKEGRNHERGGQTRFQGMDRNSDGRISRDEWRGNDMSFSNHDWNHDGIISDEEFRGKGRGSDGDARADSGFGRRRFEAIDSNRDERVSRGEWDSTFNRNRGDSAAFDRFDANRDGVLSREEFLSRAHGMQVPDALLRDLDHNRDGQLSREEWLGRQDFERLDRNRDGYLSRNELARR